MTTNGKIELKRTPAYAPYESFNRLLTRMKDCLPLPRPLDSTTWVRMRFSGSITSALKSTLIFLGLLTQDNMPTDELEELVKTDPEQRAKILLTIVDRAYAPILTKLDLERATIGQLRAEFKALGADGQVGQKAVSFFIAIAKDAGKKMHQHLTARQPRVLGPRKTSPKHEDESELPGEEKPPSRNEEGITMPKNVHPAMAGLLQILPDPKTGWTESDKSKFKVAFGALLDAVYPIIVDKNESNIEQK